MNTVRQFEPNSRPDTCASSSTVRRVEHLREAQRVGLDYLEAVSRLLQRGRQVHPTKGLFEAADFQWWWRTERSTDARGQLFWFDADGQPEAAVIATDWGSFIALNPIVLPGAPPALVAHVVERGLAHAADAGVDAVELEVSRDDEVLRQVLSTHRFKLKEEGLVESWLAAAARPEVSTLHDGYRLLRRVDTNGPHHMIPRAGAAVEERLNQTSLYRSDLDLSVRGSNGDHAAHGLFWYDPVTATGLVEPMRTEDDHQRRGLARHVLTAGIELLADAGADRIKICFEAANAAASRLYLSVGFQPVKHTDIYAGPTAAGRG